MQSRFFRQINSEGVDQMGGVSEAVVHHLGASEAIEPHVRASEAIVNHMGVSEVADNIQEPLRMDRILYCKSYIKFVKIVMAHLVQKRIPQISLGIYKIS